MTLKTSNIELEKLYFLTNLRQEQADFWQVNIFHLVALSGYANQSHDFTNLVFVTSSLFFSINLVLKSLIPKPKALSTPVFKQPLVVVSQPVGMGPVGN